MIVKLASVVIPACKGQDPSIGDGVFPGGHWHLEGMAAERIAATGIYYYDMTNVQVLEKNSSYYGEKWNKLNRR